MPDIEKPEELETITTAEEEEGAFGNAFAEFAGGEKQDEYEEVIAEEDDDPLGIKTPEKVVEPDPVEENPMLKDAREKIAALEHKLNSETGRTSALQRKMNEMEQAALDRANPANTEVDDEAIQLLKDDYPEIAAAIDAAMTQRQQQLNQELDARITASLTPIQEKEAERIRQSEQEALSTAHSDWMELNDSDDYWKWVDEQTDIVKSYAHSDQSRHVIKALDEYKKDKGGKEQTAEEKQLSIAEKRQKQIEDMRGIQSKVTGTSSQIAKDDFSNAFNHYSKKKEANQRV